MTIIAYRDGVMAADSAIWSGGSIIAGHMRKIVRHPDGSLAAATGEASLLAWFLERIETGEILQSPPKDETQEGFNGLLVRPNGDVYRCGVNMLLYPINGPWQAVGGPTAFLSGALAAGATAEEAVHLALKFTDGGGGDVQVERLVPVARVIAA